MSDSAEIQSPDQLTDDLRTALRNLILCLADSKRILGIRYADWVLGAPELEANIAASSLAQDEWGHSRLLYALLKDLGDEPERLEHEREPAAYQNMQALDQPLAAWQAFVVANAIIDTALTVQLEALTDTRYTPLRGRVQKQVEEERFHAAHGAAWLNRLGNGGDAARTAVQEALDRAWPDVLRWFGPAEFGAAGVKAGLWDAAGEELRARFLQRVEPLIQKSGLAMPDGELDFAGWDPASRRTRRDGPDADAVARARGDKNRAMLMD